MKQRDLDNLINLCKRGNQKAFAQIIAEYQQIIFSVTFRLLCNEEDAKDAVQETFIKVWLNINKYNKSKKFITWLYTIAINHCYDKIKIQKPSIFDEKLIEYFIASDDIEKQIQNKDLAEIIRSLAGELTAKQKIVFTLRYLEQFEISEIEKITKLSPKQIKDNLYLARNYIKEILRKFEK